VRDTASAVTFDLWHTLVYLEPDAEEQYMVRQIDIAVKVLDDSDPLPGTARRDEAELRKAFEREYVGAVDASGEGRTVTPTEQLVRAASASGRVPRPDAYLAALEVVVDATPFRVAPGALSVLAELRELGYQVGVISNTVGEPGRFLRPILRRLGFDRFVGTYAFSDEHPWTKPAPELFFTVLTALGSEPAAAVHVGDGWSDVEGARRAGFAGTVLFTGLQRYGERYRKLFLGPDWHRPPADQIAATLPEVVPIVRRLLGTPGE
jgi:FMN phosphatase YigB (HAD superfamily)